MKHLLPLIVASAVLAYSTEASAAATTSTASQTLTKSIITTNVTPDSTLLAGNCYGPRYRSGYGGRGYGYAVPRSSFYRGNAGYGRALGVGYGGFRPVPYGYGRGFSPYGRRGGSGFGLYINF